MIREETRARMREIVARYPQARSAMLPCLHLAQDEEGHVTPEGMAAVAEAIGVKVDEVESIVTFYSMLHHEQMGRYQIKVCTSISCYLRGCDTILDRLSDRLGIQKGETTSDGRFTLEGVECLAACGMGPVLQVNGRFVENVTPEIATELVDYLAGGGDPAAIESRWRDISGGAGMATATTIGGQPAAKQASDTRRNKGQ